MSLAIALLTGSILIQPSTSWGAWGDVTSWKNEASNGNWNDTNWYNVTQGWDYHNPNYEGGRDLQFDNNNQVTMVNDFSGNPGTNRWRITFTANATSARTISGSTGNTFFDNGGTVPRIQNDSSAGHTLSFPMKIGYSGGMEINPMSGNLTVNGAIINDGYWINAWGNNGKTLILGGVISGAGGLAVKENSTVVLSNNNTFSGGIWVEKGTVRLQGSTNALGAGSVNVGTNATLDLNYGTATLFPVALTLYNGRVTKTNANSTTWRGAFASYNSSTVTVSSGNLYIYGGMDLASGTLVFSNASDGGMMAGGTMNGSGDLIKQGAGAFRLYPGPHSGNITLSAGEIRQYSGTMAAIGTVVMESGTTYRSDGTTARPMTKAIEINGNVTLGHTGGGAVTFSGDVSLNSGVRTLTVPNTNTISGIISNGGLTKDGGGKLILSGINTYANNTTISAGTLALSESGSITNSPVISMAGGAELDVSGLSSALTLASGQGITVAASGSASAATIATAASKGLTMATNSPLVFSAFNNSGAPLTVTGLSSLTLAANPVTVTVSGGALGAGSYKLISIGSGNTTAVAGTVPSSVTVNGDGIGGGLSASLSISGGELYLVVASGKADQAITFAAIPDQVTTNKVGLAATASSGLSVSFAVGGGPAAINDQTNLSFTGAGLVSIVASQAGDGSWNPAPDVTNTFTVTKAVAGVTLNDLSQTYDGTARVVTGTTDPAGKTVDITYDGNAWAPTNAGSYAITGTVNDVMYQGSQTGTLVVAKAELTVTGATAQNKPYDGTDVAQITGATLVGVVSGDDVTLANETTGTFAQVGVGTDIAVSTAPMTITGTDIDNYTLTQPTGLIADITKADTGTELVSSRNPSVDGESVIFTATVTATPPGAGTPTGTVQFKTNGVNFGSAVTLSGGIASTNVSLPVGSYTVTAVYDGDDTFNGSTSADLVQTVESKPVISIHAAGSEIAMEWPGTNSWFYTVEYTPSFLPLVPWLELEGYIDVHGVDGAMSATDTNATSEKKFYRIKMTR